MSFRHLFGLRPAAASVVALGLAALAGYMLAQRSAGLPQVDGAGLHVVDGDTVDFEGRRWREVSERLTVTRDGRELRIARAA